MQITFLELKMKLLFLYVNLNLMQIIIDVASLFEVLTFVNIHIQHHKNPDTLKVKGVASITNMLI